MLQPALHIETQQLVSAKRGRKERSGVHAWHPYYAGYAESFVESAIRYLDLPDNAVILDPWNGSGTTTLVATRLGFASIGCDVNPVMNIFASAKQSFLVEQRETVEELLSHILKAASSIKLVVEDDDPLLEFMSRDFVSIIRKVFSTVGKVSYPKATYTKSIKRLIAKDLNSINPFQALFWAAIFILGRKVAGYKPGSNPTWIKSTDDKPSISWKEFTELYSIQVLSMLSDIAEAQFGKSKVLSSAVIESNSRQLPIEDSSISGVITSPPYLTRIDYAISVKPELLIMSSAERLREIREDTIGAPVIVDKDIVISKMWGKTCKDILTQVSLHPTKAAKSYYLPNMLQYFRDIEQSLMEIARVLKPGARGLIVVQSSYFKEIEIRLGDIYVEMIKQLGSHSEIVAREVVRGHMAHVNTKSNGYRDNKVFYEDVVLIEKMHD